MTVGRSILRELCSQPCETSELDQVLLRRYGSSGGDRNDPNALLFPGEQEQYAVKLVFNRKHALKDAVAGPLLSDSDLSELANLVEREILAPVPLKVCSWILFAALPVTGYFRFGDDFQILPVPKHAPRPHFRWADHPFLLEFRIAGSPNPMVEGMRGHRRGEEIELVLSALVANHIWSDRTMIHRWVIPPPVGDPPRLQASMFCQVGYSYEGAAGMRETFTTCDGVPTLAIVAPAEYYGRLGVRSNQEMDRPANLEHGLVTYSRLSSRLQRKFLNSCFWLQHSHTVYQASRSASYMALILAVEALMPPPETGKTCDRCKRTVGKGPTQRFKEFLSRFAPTGEAFRRELDRFYAIRSKLTHGRGLLISDREGLAGSGLEGFEDSQRQLRLHQLVQVAMINWLWSSNSITPDQR
jgi:hypothetical protein